MVFNFAKSTRQIGDGKMAFGSPKFGVAMYNLAIVLIAVGMAILCAGWLRIVGIVLAVIGLLLGFMLGSWFVIFFVVYRRLYPPD